MVVYGEIMSNIVTLVHGSGARETFDLIMKMIVSKIPEGLRKVSGGIGIDVLDDGAVIPIGDKYLIITMDSYTVKPIFFPGGSIGTLAISGTINDLVVMGARPIAIMDSITVEEGFELNVLEKIINDMIDLLKKYNIPLIGGDFKVMPRGNLDKIIITTTGIGLAQYPIVDTRIRIGDKIIVTDPIASHGAVIIASQLGLLDNIKNIKSDAKPLIDVLLPVIEKYGEYIHAARDPTRGGIAAILNEWAINSDVTIVIDRSKIPIEPEVKAFLEALGIDFLSVASEGVAILAVDSQYSDDIVNELRLRGCRAEIIGEIVKPQSEFLKGKVIAITEIGGKTIVTSRGLNLPRIC